MRGNSWFTGVVLAAFVAISCRASSPAEGSVRSSWDLNQLSVEIGDVDIETFYLFNAWKTLGEYQIRANLFMGGLSGSSDIKFIFHKKKTTARDLFNALVDAFPGFTSTQDPETGVIWIHPKSTAYQDILSQRVRVDHGATNVPMCTAIYAPLCRLLAPNFVHAPDKEESDPVTGETRFPAPWTSVSSHYRNRGSSF
jgi:hypothetical protein